MWWSKHVGRFFAAPEVSRETALRWTEGLAGLTAALASVEYLTGASQKAPGHFNAAPAFPDPANPVQRVLSFLTDSPVAARALNVLRLGAGVALLSPTSGRRTRAVAGGVVAGTSVVIFTAERYGTDGSDEVVVLASTAAALARARPHPAVADAAMWFLAAQSALAYTAAGLAKTIGPPWTSGTALHGILRTRTYGHEAAYRFLASRPELGRALTRAVVAAESAVPLLLVRRDVTAKAYVLVSGGFHVANAALMGLSRFLVAFSALYPAVLYVSARPDDDAPRDDRMLGLAAAGVGLALAGGAVREKARRDRLRGETREHLFFDASSGNRLAYRLDGPPVPSARPRGRGPLVVLVPGLAESGTYWTQVREDLQRDHDVLTVTRPGHHPAPLPAATSPDLGVQLRDLADLVADQADGRRVVLVGHSLGGLLAREAAADPRLDVLAVVGLDPTHRALTDAMRAELVLIEPTLRAIELSLRAGLGWMVERRTEYRRAQPALRDALEDEQRRWEVWRTARIELNSAVAHCRGPEPRLRDVPHHVITSEGTARTQPGQLHADLALVDGHDGGEHLRLDGTGHLTMLLRPDAAERVAGHVRRWAGHA